MVLVWQKIPLTEMTTHSNWHAAPYKTSRTLRDDITDSQEGKMLCAVMPDGEI